MPNGRCRIHGGKTTGSQAQSQRAKHGLYRKRFSGDEQELFDALMQDTNFEDLRREIALTRLVIDRCARAIAEGDEWRVPMQAMPMYMEKLLKMVERMKPTGTRLVQEDDIDKELKNMIREERLAQEQEKKLEHGEAE